MGERNRSWWRDGGGGEEETVIISSLSCESHLAFQPLPGKMGCAWSTYWKSFLQPAVRSSCHPQAAIRQRRRTFREPTNVPTRASEPWTLVGVHAQICIQIAAPPDGYPKQQVCVRERNRRCPVERERPVVRVECLERAEAKSILVYVHTHTHARARAHPHTPNLSVGVILWVGTMRREEDSWGRRAGWGEW